MITILASSPTQEISESCPLPALNEANGFTECLERLWPEEGRCLMIAAAPEAYGLNDEMTGFYRAAVENTGLPVACFDLWDDRCPGMGREEFHGYNVVFLAGGHLPTEHAWFEAIGLRELLEGFEGLVIGTSAGSMNAARMVYAWPEEEGESLDPDYELFFPGLGLAETMLLPHFQKVKDAYLDGKKLVDEIALGHSLGCRMLAVPDGSYVLVEDGVETVFGEAWLVSDGVRSLFCEEGECREFWPEE